MNSPQNRIKKILGSGRYVELLKYAESGTIFDIPFSSLSRNEILVAMALQREMHVAEIAQVRSTAGFLRDLSVLKKPELNPTDDTRKDSEI